MSYEYGALGAFDVGVQSAQQTLQVEGFGSYLGPTGVDGQWGPCTAAAIRAYIARHGEDEASQTFGNAMLARARATTGACASTPSTEPPADTGGGGGGNGGGGGGGGGKTGSTPGGTTGASILPGLPSLPGGAMGLVLAIGGIVLVGGLVAWLIARSNRRPVMRNAGGFTLCPTCQGDWWDEPWSCPTCGGVGQVPEGLAVSHGQLFEGERFPLPRRSRRGHRATKQVRRQQALAERIERGRRP